MKTIFQGLYCINLCCQQYPNYVIERPSHFITIVKLCSVHPALPVTKQTMIGQNIDASTIFAFIISQRLLMIDYYYCSTTSRITTINIKIYCHNRTKQFSTTRIQPESYNHHFLLHSKMYSSAKVRK